MRLRKFQFHLNSDWRNWCPCFRAARSPCASGYSRDARGNDGEPNVGVHRWAADVASLRRKSFMPNRKAKEKATAELVQAEKAAKFILSKTKLRPKIALVLGSGLGAFADEFSGAKKIPYAKIPHFPRSTAIGHAGQLVLGKVDGVEVAGMQGRVHLYEGYSPQQVVLPIRVFARMGVKAVILTNAAGGINLNYSAGALVAIRDHINLQGVNFLVGPNAGRFGVRFPDL